MSPADRSTDGPSPHPRGTPVFHSLGPSRCFGPSPHPRGTRRATPTRPGRCSVHPRTRGEHDRHDVDDALIDRSIPAPAGNTFSVRSSSRLLPGPSPHPRGTPAARPTSATRSPVHPRTRGEHVGSGTPTRPATRSIPAPAGNTPSHSIRSLSRSGPSPHPRGTPRVTADSVIEHRSIPAPAGNT